MSEYSFLFFIATIRLFMLKHMCLVLEFLSEKFKKFESASIFFVLLEILTNN